MSRDWFRKTAAVVLLAVVLGACQSPPQVSSRGPQADLLPELRNLTYHGIYNYPVTLAQGVYAGEPFVAGGTSRPRVELLDDLILRGNLDGNRTDEQVVFLGESSGGSGTRIYLAVVAFKLGELRNTGTALLGDRVQIRSATVKDGELRLSSVERAPEDAACCPTRKVRRIYRLRDGALTLESLEDQGTISVSDIEGVSWQLKQFDRGQPKPAGVTITAELQAGRISGSSGCNRYFAAVKGGAGQDLTIDLAVSTRVACPEPEARAEIRYLRHLAGVTRFSFQLRRLALTYRQEEAWGTLLFERD